MEDLLSQNAVLREECDHLREQVEWFRRQFFGHKTEKLVAPLATSDDLFGKPPEATSPTSIEVAAHQRQALPKVGHGRAPLPEDLLREEIVLDVPESEKTCSCCGKERVRIGEDVREELHLVAPHFVVRRYVRPKYACRQCTEEGVTQAPPVVSVIDKGIPSVELVVWIVLAKYMDHLPLHRIAGQFKRWGVEVSETTMIGWIAEVFELLGPIHRALEHEIRQTRCLHVDETTLRVQHGDKDQWGRGKTSIDQLWAMLGRAPDGTPVGVSFLHFDSRKYEVAKEILKDFHDGSVVSDGYEAYASALIDHPGVLHAACWAHARRRFHEALLSGDARAKEPLKQIKAMYKEHANIGRLIERIREHRKGLEQEFSQEQIDAIVVNRRRKRIGKHMKLLEDWNKAELAYALPKSKMGSAIIYLNNQFPRLKLCLDHARIDLDNNIIERAIRAVAVGRKNWLFAGSDEGAKRAALLISLAGTCRMLDLDPVAYFSDVLLRMRIRPNDADCADLTPIQWKNRTK